MNKTVKSILIALGLFVCVFGGIASLIQADYAKTPAGTDAWYWTGGILLGSFALGMIIWFSTSGNRRP